MIRVRDFDIDTRCLVEVFGGVVLLGPEDRPDLDRPSQIRPPSSSACRAAGSGSKTPPCRNMRSGKSSVPPSVAAATIFGVVMLMKLFLVEEVVYRMHRSAPDLEDRSDAGPAHVKEPCIKPGIEFCPDFLRDIKGKRGFGKADDLKEYREQVPCRPALFLRLLPCRRIRTTDSRETFFAAASTASDTFFFGMVTWMIPVLSRIKKNASPPRSLSSWTHPQTSAWPVSGVTDCMGIRIKIVVTIGGGDNGFYGR